MKKIIFLIALNLLASCGGKAADERFNTNLFFPIQTPLKVVETKEEIYFMPVLMDLIPLEEAETPEKNPKDLITIVFE